MRFSGVIFATDFSETSRTAGRFAALLANRYRVDLTVVHAFALEQPAVEAEALSHLASMQRQDLLQLVTATAADLARSGVRTVPVLSEGSAVGVVRAAAEAQPSGLVVLGTHGGGAMERHLLGSVAEAILRSLRTPVLTVGPHVPMPDQDRFGFRHILYATNFSAGAAASAVQAFALADEFGADVDLLHVVRSDDAPERGGNAEGIAISDLDRLVPAGHGRGAVHSFAEAGDVREVIVAHARARGVDLIVLGAHHHSALAMHLRTGPAFQVILHAPCPVLTVSVDGQ